MKKILFFCILLILIQGLFGAATAAITTVSFDESSGSAFPVTFGLLFKKGAVPLGKSVTGRIGSSNISIQVDQIATHSGGSYRYAILSAIIPAGATTMDIVVSDSAFGGTPVSVGSNHGTTVTINSTTVSPTQFVEDWLSGPIVTEKAFVSFPTPHITVFLNVRKYSNGDERHDVTVENALWNEGGDNTLYSFDIKNQGLSKFSGNDLNHIRHTRWRKVFWVTGDEGLTNYAPGYLQSTKGILNYNPNHVISEGQLGTYGAKVTNDAIFGPMMQGDFLKAFGTTGQSGAGRTGHIPQWGVAYILTGDERARDYTLRNGDVSGSVPWHFRSRETLQPFRISDVGGAVTWKTKYVDQFSDGQFFGNILGESTGWTLDFAHEPNTAFAAALISGDKYYFDEMHFINFWQSAYVPPGNRRLPDHSVEEGRMDGILVGMQLRGDAWSLRTLSDAEYITADNHYWKSELRRMLENNLKFYWKGYVESGTYGYGSTSPHTPLWNLGIIPKLSGKDKFAGSTKTWMQDWMLTTFVLMADRGDPRAVQLAGWKGRSMVRFHKEDWCRYYAANSSLYVLDPDTLIARSSWTEIIGGDPNCPGPFSTASRYSGYAVISLGGAGAASTYNSDALISYKFIRSEFDDFDYKWDIVPRNSLSPPGNMRIIE